MPYLSAPDAISPAIQRTRTFLFRPFRFGTYLKLCLVALLTEGFGSNFNSSGGRGFSSRHRHTAYSPPSFHLTHEWVAAAIAMGLLVILLCFFLFYLITRLRFAYFHCLIHNTREIRPGWHLYRSQAARFFWMNLVVGFCFLLLVLLIALPFGAGFLRLIRATQAGGHPSISQVLALLLPLIPLILLLVLLAIAVDLVLRDFMLPHYALENATAGQAWSAVWARIATEKAPFFVYALLRVILPIVALIGLFIVLILPAILFFVVVIAVEVAMHAAFSGATGAAQFLGIFLQVLIGFVAFVMAALAGICLGGPLSTAVREFALIFYGGRYKPLGDILYPPPPPAPPIPPPQIIPPAPAIS
jgi:hypothetical protein